MFYPPDDEYEDDTNTTSSKRKYEDDDDNGVKQSVKQKRTPKEMLDELNKDSGLKTKDFYRYEWYSDIFQNKLRIDAKKFANTHYYIPRLWTIDENNRQQVIDDFNNTYIGEYPVVINGKIDLGNYALYSMEQDKLTGRKKQKKGGKSNKRKRSNKKNAKRTTRKSNKSHKRHKVNHR